MAICWSICWPPTTAGPRRESIASCSNPTAIAGTASAGSTTCSSGVSSKTRFFVIARSVSDEAIQKQAGLLRVARNDAGPRLASLRGRKLEAPAHPARRKVECAGPFQHLGHDALDQLVSEAAPLRRLHRRSAAFLPLHCNALARPGRGPFDRDHTFGHG